MRIDVQNISPYQCSLLSATAMQNFSSATHYRNSCK